MTDSVESDPEYRRGIRSAIVAALDYGLDVVAYGEKHAARIPTPLLEQARLAARYSVSLDAVLRRYLAGFSVLGDFLVEEAVVGGQTDGPALQVLMRSQAAVFERVIGAVTEEYALESAIQARSVDQNRAARVKRLIAGELIDPADLAYDFDALHIGLVAKGHGVSDLIRRLAKTLECRLLLVSPGEEIAWAWLGCRSIADMDRLDRAVASAWPRKIPLAIGEPRPQLAGWRRTHQQALAAFPIAMSNSATATRYADVALLASMLQDHLLATSLDELYLAPLRRTRRGGAVLRETLRAYFAAERNGASAAAALGVSRQTVNNRLKIVEERVCRPLSICAGDLEAALQLEDIGGSDGVPEMAPA